MSDLSEYKAAVIKAVCDEPELTDEMPDEMWDAIRYNKDVFTLAMRTAVSLTKTGILKRIQDIP